MKRQSYRVSVTDSAGEILATGVRFAMNAGIREAEALVRELAQRESTVYHGARPQRMANRYTRSWVSGAGREVIARIAET